MLDVDKAKEATEATEARGGQNKSQTSDQTGFQPIVRTSSQTSTGDKTEEMEAFLGTRPLAPAEGDSLQSKWEPVLRRRLDELLRGGDGQGVGVDFLGHVAQADQPATLWKGEGLPVHRSLLSGWDVCEARHNQSLEDHMAFKVIHALCRGHMPGPEGAWADQVPPTP